jgi:glycosyltransferase involved in cell wall biosynthesis
MYVKILKNIVRIIVSRDILWPFYFPIISLMKKIKVNNLPNKSNGVSLLAINPGRFRGDLEVLAKFGFDVYEIPYKWQTRVFHFYRNLESKSEFQKPAPDSSISVDRIQLRSYLSRLLVKIFNKKGINCVIGAGLFYNQDLDWGAATVNAGYPYIVFHRENLIVSKYGRLNAIKKAKLLNEMGFSGSAIVFQNKEIKNIYDKYSGVDTEMIHALGANRMDQYIKDIKSKKNTSNNRRITLFTFNSNILLPGKVDNIEWHQLYKEVHTSFVELAKENPDIEFIIKHKGVRWDETEVLLESLNAFNLDNLKTYGEFDYDVHKLILESDVVTGFCSTTLLEASIAGKPVIYPLFAEAGDEKNSDFICFSEALDMFDVVKSSKNYKELLMERAEFFKISEETMKLRNVQFERYVSSLKSDSTEKYSELITNEVRKSSQCI